VALIWTNDLHGLMRRNVYLDTAGPFSVVGKTYGPWFWIHAAYNYVLLGIAIYLFVETLRRALPLYRGQILALLIGLSLPLAWNTLYTLGISPIRRHDVAPAVFGVSGIVAAWGLFRYRLFDIMPIARATVIESMEDGVIVLDVQNRIVDLNPAAQRILGQPASQVVGRSAAQVFSPWPDLMELCRKVSLAHAESILSVGDYDVRLSLLSDRRDRPIGRVVVFHDVTERKRQEEALRQYALDLHIRNEELDVFAHTVAHDLKNPLTMIISYADALHESSAHMPKEEMRKYLQTIIDSGYRMNNIIDELLLLAEVRGKEVEREPLDMAGIVAAALRRLAPMIEEHQVEIIVPAVWPAALGYAPWVEEVWVNYLSNAFKYGGRPPRVELGAMVQADGMVRYWVRDNGSGLTREEQVRLFVPFTRLDQVRARGHGLGLSAVRRIVEKLGGEVGVESDGVPGRGSVFCFTLPGIAIRFPS
jgi:signal transduction histidine kinase